LVGSLVLQQPDLHPTRWLDADRRGPVKPSVQALNGATRAIVWRRYSFLMPAMFGLGMASEGNIRGTWTHIRSSRTLCHRCHSGWRWRGALCTKHAAGTCNARDCTRLGAGRLGNYRRPVIGMWLRMHETATVSGGSPVPTGG
jgi:hypothetical protein